MSASCKEGAIGMSAYQAPLFDGRSDPVMEQVRQLAPGTPIRYVINSHSQFDHTGGLRTAMAEGASIGAGRRGQSR
jgi:glyoxylase-like metal-dependent hydrolase (beta-lactamase superfamily II)